jgi:hypothetical protein
MKCNLLFLFTFLILSLSLVSSLDTSSSNPFGYYNPNLPNINEPDTTTSTGGGTTNNYYNQTVNATVNSTQFDSNDPITIKTSWLTSFIEALSKWANYWTKTENIDQTGYNITADTFKLGNNNSFGVWSNSTDMVIGYIQGL